MNKLKVINVAAVDGSASLLIIHNNRAFMYDIGFGFCAHKTADMVEKLLSGGKPESIILTHSHYDHVMGSAVLAQRWNNTEIIAGDYAAYVFTRPSAKKLMHEMDINAAHELGLECDTTDMTDNLHVDRTVSDEEEFEVCGLKLRTIALPGHTKCSIGFYCEEYKTLFSSETLGVFGEGKAMPNLLTSFKDGVASLEKASKLGAENIIIPHYGMISGKEKCDNYFKNARHELNWVLETTIDMNASGADDKEIVEKIKERYHVGFIRQIYPVKAFYLNTGYMVPTIIREYCNYDILRK